MKIGTSTTYIIEARSATTGWGLWYVATELAEANEALRGCQKIHKGKLKFRLIEQKKSNRILYQT